VTTTKTYCPYTDKDLDPSETTEEHIIPKSLGGHDALVLPVEKGINSELGTSIDGALANDFFISKKRSQYDARGHSRKEPVFVMKNAKDVASGRPLQLRWGKKLEVFDPVERLETTGSKKVEANFELDPDIRLRFLAKSFLSAGYFSYGETFRTDVEHEEPRLLMRSWHTISDAEAQQIKTRAYTWIDRNAPGEQQEELNLQRAICSLIQGSIFVLCPSKATLGAYGSVLGEYLGFLNVPADTSRFPRTGNYDLGHALIVSGDQFLRWSYRRLLGRLLLELEKRNVPAASPGDTK